MRKLVAIAAVMGLAITAVVVAQPPGGRGGRGEGRGPQGGPPPYELGKILPPFVREGIDLTDEQQKQLAELEKEVKEKLTKILTEEQRKKIGQLRPRGPGGPGGPPPGGPDDGPPPDDRRPEPPKDKDDTTAKAAPGSGIAWYATLDSGLKEAKRTGKPILFLAAAPHCGGVSGIW